MEEECDHEAVDHEGLDESQAKDEGGVELVSSLWVAADGLERSASSHALTESATESSEAHAKSSSHCGHALVVVHNLSCECVATDEEKHRDCGNQGHPLIEFHVSSKPDIAGMF